MKFNLWMFAEQLSEYEPQVVVHTEIKQDLENIRLFFPSTKRDFNTLYIETGDVILGNGDQRVYGIQGDNYFILNSNQVNLVFNSIITILEETQIWVNHINSMISSDCLLSDVLNEFKEKIPFPMMVLDASQTALAISGAYGRGTLDERWDSMIETGSLGLETISIYNELYKDALKEKDFYQIPAYPFPYPSFNRNIFSNGEFMGYLSTIQKEGELTEGQKGWLYIAWEMVTQWVSLHIIQNDLLLKQTVFEELLSGNLDNISYFLGTLGASGWNPDCSKMIMVLSCVSNHLNMNSHIAKLLNQHHQFLFSAEYNNTIILLINTDKISMPELFRIIQPTIQQSGYYGGYSNIFTRLSELSHFYMQAMLTLRSEKAAVGEIISCQEHLLPYIFHILNKYSYLSLSHPALPQLKQYDETHNTELYKVLYVYLKNQSNQTESAAELNMHRSSLLRKIALILEITELDLGDYNTRLHLLLSYELEIRENKKS